jgi:hypothetical protein
VDVARLSHGDKARSRSNLSRSCIDATAAYRVVLVTITNKVETKMDFDASAPVLIRLRLRDRLEKPVGRCVLMSVPGYASKKIAKRQCDMCNGRFGLVRQRFGYKQFCCKACLDDYRSCVLRGAHRSRRWLEFLARKE